METAISGDVDMKAVEQLEKTIAEWFAHAPHFSTEMKRWLGDNIWWLTAVVVLLSLIGFSTMLPILGSAVTFDASYAPYALAPYTVPTGSLILYTWVKVVFLAVIIFFEAIAIFPLREKKKSGWNYIFIAMLLAILSGVIGFVIIWQPSNLIGLGVGAVLGGYILFELRDQFTMPKIKK